MLVKVAVFRAALLAVTPLMMILPQRSNALQSYKGVDSYFLPVYSPAKLLSSQQGKIAIRLWFQYHEYSKADLPSKRVKPIPTQVLRHIK